MVDGKQRTSTAFLVGAFDIGVTVAHMFQKGASGAEPSDCTYNSIDSARPDSRAHSGLVCEIAVG